MRFELGWLPLAASVAMTLTAAASIAQAPPASDEEPLPAVNVVDLRQTLDDGPSIAVVGHVRRAGVPVPNVDVVALKSPFGRAIHGTCDSGGTPVRSQPTAEDGSFEVVVRGSGTYCLRVEGPAHNYPLSVHDIPDEPSGTVDIDLPSVCASGTVVDASSGEPVARVNVAAMEEWPWPRFSRGFATTSRDGRFHLDIEPGDYTVQAWLEEGGVGSEEVSVGESGLDGVLLKLAPAQSVVGRVIDQDGNGVPDVEVRQHPQSPQQRWGWTKTGPRGFFRIEGMLDQEHVLVAESDERYGIRRGVVPGEGNVVLRLRGPGYVDVTVRDAQGQPVEGAMVSLKSIDGLAAAVWVDAVTDEEGLAEMTVPPGSVALAVAGAVESGKREILGETVVSVREKELVSATLEIRQRPLPDE